MPAEIASSQTLRVPLAEPVAVIGMGCRFPGGVESPSAYIDFLRRRGDGVVDVPADRFRLERYFHEEAEAPGRAYTRRGGFLAGDITAFDPVPFSISPREAERLDPQQRLLLEVTWEAFEDAGLRLDVLAGSRTGVFVGGFTLDQMALAAARENQPIINAHTSTGMTMTVLSNRLSYTFDLRGPSLTVDTACSSSLVAVHLACRAIAEGSCEMAVAGGVNVMLSPVYSIVMCKGHFLAKDGRSKAFDASADGYGRGEGAGVVVLKRLSRALADKDRIHAIIKGSAVNQDGRTDGMPMPSEEAQEALIAEACARAGVEPRAVGYVEAHGTGTRAGDPVEARAIGRVYGRGRAEGAALPIGSVKTNIGHLEAAAGIAGLIKSILIVRERRVLPQRALVEPNPDIPFEDLHLKVAVDEERWPEEGEAIAAVNSFGYGGTNAHVLVAGPPRTGGAAAVTARAQAGASGEGALHLLPLSAPTPDALSAVAGRMAAHLERSASNLEEVAATAAHRRTHHAHRAAVLAADRERAGRALEALSRGEAAVDVVTGRVLASPRVTWVFTGMGPQWWAMGRELLEGEPVFARAARDVDARFAARAGWSILDAMLADEARSEMARNRVAQPANFVLQVGLVELLRSRGTRCDGILGHSVGEVAAAWAAGCLDLDDAVTIAVHRSCLQQEVAGGAMLAAAVGVDEARALIHPGADACVAAENGPASVALAGARADLEEIAAVLAGRGVFHRFMPVEVAYHSAHMEPIEARMREALIELAPRAPSLPLYSTMSGLRVDGPVHDAGYWWRNARQPVLLGRALERAIDDGANVFLEVGPHPVLAPSIRGVLEHRGVKGACVATLRRQQPERLAVARASAELYTLGAEPDWSKLVAPAESPADLPTYPWRRERHWAETRASLEARIGRAGAHPLLDEDLHLASPTFISDLGAPGLGYLRDHEVDGAVVFPGAGYIEAALALVRAARGAEAGEFVLEEVAFERPLVLPPRHDGVTRSLGARLEGDAFSLASRTGEEAWTEHARGRAPRLVRYRELPRVDVAALRARCDRVVDARALYGRFAARGLRYGPAFRGLQEAWIGADEVIARVDVSGAADVDGYTLHPALLDAAFQSLLALAPEGPGLVPVRLERLRVLRPAGASVWVHGARKPGQDGAFVGDLTLLLESGEPVASARGLVCRPLTSGGDRELARRVVHVAGHVEVGAAGASARELPFALVASPDDTTAAALEAALRARGARARHAGNDELPRESEHAVFLAPPDEDSAAALARLTALVQALPGTSRLSVVTRRAVAVFEGDDVAPSQAALTGLCRVVMTERPELSCRLVDVGDVGAPTPEGLDALAAELCATDEEEVALRVSREGAARRFALRVHKSAVENERRRAERLLVDASAAEVELVVERPGRLESLVYRPAERRPPAPGEVEVEVYTVGLNFKDVMKAMGLLSSVALERTYLGTGLGLEAVGVVTAVGDGVQALAPGDLVHAYAGGCFRSHLCVPERFVVKCAPGHDPVDAASYFVFATAWYSLEEAARVRPGERVLIHSAAGGVGLAAVQIAAWRGAEVFATAGTEEKRAHLRALGVHHVFDSRTLDFADEVLERTGGEGVDVVVSALAGESQRRSLEIVAPGGRFVELGKTDIASDGALRLLPFNRSIAFFAVDLDRLATERPGFFAPLAQRVTAAFSEGVLRPLPTEVFSAADVEGAFRCLASGRHIGKVVVDLRRGALPVAPGLAAKALARPDRSYLVTGGLSGFGLATASWLVEQGARHLVLASRRGAPDLEALEAIDGMRAAGAEVRCLSLDVTDRAAVLDAIAALADGAAPLAGVFHSAMVLDDKPIAALDEASLARVFDPKARGAWNLHLATAGLELDHFVLYSSVSALVGNPGQGAYAAANAFLDGLCAHRRARGMSATSVQWGAIGEVGAVARDARTADHLRRLGLSPLPPRASLDLLGRLLTEDRGNVGVIDIDWDRWAAAMPETPWHRLSGVLSKEGLSSEQDRLSALLEAVPEARHADVVREAIAAEAGRVFKVKPDAIDAARPLKDYGLDSLMAVELQAGIQQALGVEIPSMELLAGRSIDALVGRVLKQRSAPEAAPVPASGPARHDDLRADLLARICVQPPYFALDALRVEGEGRARVLHAEVAQDPASPEEEGAVSSAEAARHLAILGSCAVALAHENGGKVYYPVHRATLLQSGPAARGARLERLALSARLVRLDVGASAATAEAEMRDLEGALVCRFSIDYHVIPEAAFRALFAAHAQPTGEASGHDPYATNRTLETRIDAEGRVRAHLDAVEASGCLGHFVGYPAFPVSIMARDALTLVAAGLRARKGDPGARLVVRGGGARTERFLWAGQPVDLEAFPVDADARRWKVELSSGGELAACFEIDVDVLSVAAP